MCKSTLEQSSTAPHTLVPVDYFLLDIFLRLRSETWIHWTIKAAQVKVRHRPFFLRMVLWCIRLTRLTLDLSARWVGVAWQSLSQSPSLTSSGGDHWGVAVCPRLTASTSTFRMKKKKKPGDPGRNVGNSAKVVWGCWRRIKPTSSQKVVLSFSRVNNWVRTSPSGNDVDLSTRTLRHRAVTGSMKQTRWAWWETSVESF